MSATPDFLNKEESTIMEANEEYSMFPEQKLNELMEKSYN